MPIRLSRSYVARDGAPVIRSVDPAIFSHTYYTACMSCTFCGDACCDHGVDVDVVAVDRILADADAIEPLVGRSRSDWFVQGFTEDADFAGGRATRTRVFDGACVFKRRDGRGCLLHAHALETGRDYHDLKPIVSALFPVTFTEGMLCLSEELEDGTLVCGGEGPTAYAGVRSELTYYFGNQMVAELDELQRRSIPDRS